MEFLVHRQLARKQKFSAGLYKANPKGKTTRPTAEKLLVAFRGFTLYFHRDDSTKISPLNYLQQQTLALVKKTESIYIVPLIHSEVTHINRSILSGD